MTKEQYLSMCEQLGSTPDPAQLPVEIDDLPDDAISAITVFQTLPDIVDGFSGLFHGKDLSSINDIMSLMAISDKYHTFLFLRTIIDIFKQKSLSKFLASKEDK